MYVYRFFRSNAELQLVQEFYHTVVVWVQFLDALLVHKTVWHLYVGLRPAQQLGLIAAFEELYHIAAAPAGLAFIDAETKSAHYQNQTVVKTGLFSPAELQVIAKLDTICFY